MKKIIFISALNIFVVMTSWGQLNPVRKLYWATSFSLEDQQMCDTLSWHKPVPSLTDTLIGYNIYQNDHLYSFTTDTFHVCQGCNNDYSSTFCNFINYHGPGYWYIHVTAVYNKFLIESNYNDSIYWNFDMWPIGIKELTDKDLNITSIIQNNSSITIELNQSVNNGMLIISNILGQEIKEVILQNREEIKIPTPSTGLYIISLKTNRGNITRKIIIT